MGDGFLEAGAMKTHILKMHDLMIKQPFDSDLGLVSDVPTLSSGTLYITPFEILSSKIIYRKTCISQVKF